MNEKPFKVSPCMVRHIDGVGYQSGTFGTIMGVAMVIPEKDDKPRPCFVVWFPNGKVDYCPFLKSGYDYEYQALDLSKK